MQKFQAKVSEFLDVAAKYVPSPKFMSGSALALVVMLAMMQFRERYVMHAATVEIRDACLTMQSGIDKLERGVAAYADVADDIRLVHKNIDRVESRQREDQERFALLVMRVDSLNRTPAATSQTAIVTAPTPAPVATTAPVVEEPVEEVVAEAKPKRRWYYLWIY